MGIAMMLENPGDWEKYIAVDLGDENGMEYNISTRRADAPTESVGVLHPFW
jgi:hypothetical protein